MQITLTVEKKNNSLSITPDPGYPSRWSGERLYSKVREFLNLTWKEEQKLNKGEKLTFSVSEYAWDKFNRHSS